MACIFVLGPCFCCRQLFTFNAELVPSIPVNGETEPICQRCVDKVNPRRIANGLDPIVPLPGAYDPEDLS